MLDSIMDGLKGQIGGMLSDKGISTDQVGTISSLAGDSIKETAMSQISAGNMGGIMDLFKGGQAGGSNPIVSMIVSNLIPKLTDKLGFGANVSTDIANGIVPSIMSSVVSKFSESDNEPDASGIASFLGGGGGMMDAAKGMLGDLF